MLIHYSIIGESKQVNYRYIFNVIFINIIVKANFTCSSRNFDSTPSFKFKEWKVMKKTT